eukprot:CAMPEP_0169076714 /NCGR_PEP_ID=MMETSP1015-20121227/8496_1 /TAXON_ID=342587 /ORGANISM="Karlodinium micrum, Strain CCMP2283" /LENGTH=118 /DNA_ID=CAMNT_0009136197 /DNA_START=328 /DNA_END=684 /DNA_ORIENTATION=-
MTQTVQEYDLSKFVEMATGLVMTSVICFGIHYKWQYFIPLVLQVVMTPMTTLDNPLTKVYLLGQEPKGSLRRPWTPPDPMGFNALMKGQQQSAAAKKKEDKAAKLEAKKEKAKAIKKK